MQHVDGSQGEGGGQIIRSSLALAMITQTPVAISDIRAGRPRPGLMRQHLTAVEAAAAVCGGRLEGAAIGSRAVTFYPGPVQGGEYRFAIGTAGSATLVLQTVMPALLHAETPARLVLEGGTHNQWAPPFDFLQRCFLPLVERMGPRVRIQLQRHGFYPAGGGRIVAEIEPTPLLQGFDLVDRGQPSRQSLRSLVANLPMHIAQREVREAVRRLGWPAKSGHTEVVEADGPGNVLMVEIEFSQLTAVFTGFGRQGVRAEQVAKNVVREVEQYLAADVPVDPHLADQLMLPLGISAWQQASTRRGGSFRTLPLTEHAKTQIQILRQFLEIEIQVEEVEQANGICRVTLGPPLA